MKYLATLLALAAGGTVLCAQTLSNAEALSFPGTRGVAAIREACKTLSARFDGPPAVLRAIESSDGKSMRVLFTATLRGRPIRGFAAAVDGQVQVVYDRAETYQL